MIGSIVETDVLLKLIAGALAAGVGVTTAFAFAIYGAANVADAQRDGRTAAAVVFGVLTVVALAAFAGGVAYGISVITTK